MYPPIQWVPGALSLGVKHQGRKADRSPPFSAEVKECVELHLHSPNMPSWRGAQLKKKHRDNFTFTLRTQSFVQCSPFIRICCGWSWVTWQLTVSMSWPSAPLRLLTRLQLKSDNYGIDVMGRLPWREDESVFFTRPLLKSSSLSYLQLSVRPSWPWATPNLCLCVDW
jgi:hypothetical protein